MAAAAAGPHFDHYGDADIISQSKNSGGRPRNNWTSSRRRKLVRLYILTSLTITEIQKALQSESFNPSRRDIQSRLRELLSNDYSKFHRDFRPGCDFNMRLRLEVVQRCRKACLMKCQGRFCSLPGRSLRIASAYKGSFEAFRGEPLLPSSLGSWYIPSGYPHSQIVNPYLLMLDGSMVRREIKIGYAKQKTRPANPSSVQHEDARRLQPIFPEDKIKSNIAEVKPVEHEHSITKGKIRTELGKHYTDAFMEHIDSTLSATESRRSSDVSVASLTNSMRSCEISITKQHTIRNNEFGTSVGFEPEGSALSLSQHEMAIWNDLVDENKCDTKPWLEVPYILPLRYPEVALATRTCCKMPDIGDHNFLCKYCGFTQTHHFAKLSHGRVLRRTEEINKVDHFGNTPLHCAVATGAMNLTGLRYLIDNGADINARNSFGETFMHLITCIARGEENDYINLLTLLGNLDFPFTQRDFHGRTILHVLFQRTPLPLLSTKIMHQILAIMKLDINLRDNRGYTIHRLLELDLGMRSSVAVSNEILLETAPISTELQAMRLDHKSSWVEIWEGSESPYLLSGLQQIDLEEPMDWIDSTGDTILTSLLKLPCWNDAANEHNLIHIVKEILAAGASMHTRDRNGNAPLALATKKGLRSILLLLLRAGVNPNTRNYDGTSLLSQASLCMLEATKVGDDRLYATILSCFTLLVDSGANAEPTQREEWLYNSMTFNCSID
ncbi:hypothetical protein G7Y89_g7308 [Cudoniella acicularis]|uniref:Ankyrin n=1 Tax=Cudoniella acicularis TaxID=354080 RepID=A0A8H4RKD1_9HELO|nr:hypothetical protein G7Y89_g7308 [Cudoniella acicularis]